MDEEDFETFLDLDVTPLPSRRLRRADVLVLGFGLFYRLSTAVTTTLEQAHDLMAMHANYEVDRDIFQEEASREIEMLTGATEEQDG